MRPSRAQRSLILLSMLLAPLASASAQFGRPEAPSVQTRLATPRPHYTGEPVRIQVQAMGFSTDEPTCKAIGALPDNMTYLGMQPQQSSFTSIINGRRSERVIVNYIFIYELRDQQPGVKPIPIFEVAVADKKYRTRPLRVRLDKIEVDPRLRIRVVLPERSLYVGQEVPVLIEWWTENALFERRDGQDIQVPLLALSSDFKLAYDAPTSRRDQAIAINGDNGISVKCTAERRSDGGKSYVVVTAPVNLIPLRAGTFSPPPASLTLNEITSYKRTVFGRQPAGARKIAALDLPRSLEILDVPKAGRPATFSGALGSGYTLEVTAERTVVQVGEPVRLTVKLTGHGLLETAGPPRFAAGGLAPQQFRVRADNLAGTIEENTKTFEVTARVLDVSVREIPPIEYSWFDPTRQEYRTTSSQPVALRVKEGQVVSAADVVQSKPPTTTDSEAVAVDVVSVPGEGSGRPRFTLTGANLSLLEDSTTGGLLALATPMTIVLMHVLPLCAIGLAIFGRRRANLDPEIARRRRLLAEQMRIIGNASGSDARTAARDIANALRTMLAETTNQRPADVDEVIAKCDAVVFAPSDQSAALDAATVARSREIAEHLGAGGSR
ncbi:MAG: BatD family protein [Planctomycetota bacterium]